MGLKIKKIYSPEIRNTLKMKKLTTLRLDESLVAALTIVAQDKNSTVTDVITEAIILFLKEHSINNRLPFRALIKHRDTYLKSSLQSNEILLGKNPVTHDINSIEDLKWILKMGFEIIPNTNK